MLRLRYFVRRIMLASVLFLSLLCLEALLFGFGWSKR